MAVLPAAAISAEIRAISRDVPAIELKGQIRTGDGMKIKQMLKKMTEENGRTGEVILNSHGGNFMEGIYIGMEIFENGWATRVLADGVCLSACATAFLGGRYKIPDSGWLPDRNLDAGATLGFHSFYMEDSLQGSVARSLDAGKNIANIFYAYADMLNIRSDVIVRLLDIEADSVLVAVTPELLRDLSINVGGLKSNLTRLAKAGAINASAWLVEGEGPVLLDESENNWRLKPFAKNLSLRDFKKEILRRLVAESGNHGRISAIFAGALANEAQLEEVYGELVRLGFAPTTAGVDKIIKVSGLDHSNPFMNRVAYFLAKNENTPAFEVDYLLCAAQAGGGRCDEGNLKKYGDIIYELWPRDEPIWPMKSIPPEN